MPKIFGLNLIAVLAAAIAFYFVGFVWYGVVFSDAWMAAEGLTAADVQGDTLVWMIGGFIITLAQVIGIGLVMKWRGAASLGKAAMTAFILWLVFALPIVHYDYLYLPAHNPTLLMIDASHLLVGWVVSAIVLSLFKN